MEEVWNYVEKNYLKKINSSNNGSNIFYSLVFPDDSNIHSVCGDFRSVKDFLEKLKFKSYKYGFYSVSPTQNGNSTGKGNLYSVFILAEIDIEYDKQPIGERVINHIIGVGSEGDSYKIVSDHRVVMKSTKRKLVGVQVELPSNSDKFRTYRAGE